MRNTLFEIQESLKEIRDLIIGKAPTENDMLTTEQAAAYLKISRSALYKLTSERKIRFSSPTGKRNYFQKEELHRFLQQNTINP